ncbi:unnamed protein product [Ilex paraguariensis]|uniref:WRKY domain-containing protein n=1 Tax=Ilex paraguariensis TaxID=185542 RepID=A0ABC8RQ70_9AQUA
MGKGWGLTLDNSDPPGLFFNKPVGYNLTPKLNNKRDSMFSGMGFPVNLSRREEPAVLSPVDEDRVVVGEVDFFSDKKRSNDDMVVKLENSPPRTNQYDVNTGLNLLTGNTGSDQSTVDDSTSSDMEYKRAKDEMVLLQVELERMNTENQRLRGMLSTVSNNYSALQMHLVTLMQQQQSSKTETTQELEVVGVRSEDQRNEVGGLRVPRQFMDLGPSATTEANESSQSLSEERTLSGSPQNNLDLSKNKNLSEGREESPESQGWVPNKVPKLSSPKPVDQAMEATMRKARVSVRARSEAPMISDGCQWRKYGQKMAKGNPCPRAYYRCTMAVGCPVRKQVQRCAEDRTILITTYEGTHNHPLPPAAVAMASTTSAAANMLLSGSMSSADGMMNPNILARAIFPCSSSMATISASAPFPTVTLDLTQTPNPLQFQRPPPQFQVPFPGAPQVFGQALYNQSKFSGLQLSKDMDSSQLLPHQGSSPQLHQTTQHPSFAETLSAATAAITADPNFTAALAAAITSIIGGANANNNNKDTTTTTNTNTNISTTSNKTSSFPGN